MISIPIPIISGQFFGGYRNNELFRPTRCVYNEACLGCQPDHQSLPTARAKSGLIRTQNARKGTADPQTAAMFPTTRSLPHFSNRSTTCAAVHVHTVQMLHMRNLGEGSLQRQASVSDSEWESTTACGSGSNPLIRRSAIHPRVLQVLGLRLHPVHPHTTPTPNLHILTWCQETFVKCNDLCRTVTA